MITYSACEKGGKIFRPINPFSINPQTPIATQNGWYRATHQTETLTSNYSSYPIWQGRKTRPPLYRKFVLNFNNNGEIASRIIAYAERSVTEESV